MSERKVQPIQLVFKDKYWYLYGFCLLKNDYRFFKLTRMTELKVLTESFCRDFSELEIGKTIKYSFIEMYLLRGLLYGLCIERK